MSNQQSFQSELCLVSSRRRSVGWSEGKPDQENISHETASSVRVLKEGGQAILKRPYADLAELTPVIPLAVSMAEKSPKDPHRQLGKVAPAASALPIDTEIFKRPNERWLEIMSDTEKAVLALDKRLKKIARIQLSESKSSQMIQNSLGLEMSEDSTATSFSVEILAEDQGQVEVAWDWRAVRFGTDINIKETAQAVAQHALDSLGGRPIASGEYSVVVHPRVGCQLLGLLENALSAESVQRNRSFLKGKLGQKIASAKIQIWDDPLLERGLASRVRDDEGTGSRVLPIITEGVLKGVFYDLRTASRDGVVSTGHGTRAGVASAPTPHASNLFIREGSTSMDELLRASSKVFLWQDALGFHMADPMTGEFSLGASGFLYENGRRVQAVRGITIAGKLEDLLLKTTAVGNQLTWYASHGAPAFLVETLMIGGN